MATPLWPDNVQAYDLWAIVCGQWRAGAGGAFALDYGVLFQLLDRKKLQDDERDELFEEIRTMEVAALEAMQAQ